MQNKFSKERLIAILTFQEKRDQINCRVKSNFSRRIAALALYDDLNETKQIRIAVQDRCLKLFGTADPDQIAKIILTKKATTE